MKYVREDVDVAIFRVHSRNATWYRRADNAIDEIAPVGFIQFPPFFARLADLYGKSWRDEITPDKFARGKRGGERAW